MLRVGVGGLEGGLDMMNEALKPSEFRPFPPMDKAKFRDLLDEEMGFM